MASYAVLLEYQGEAFEGWQIQGEGSRTVQGCLREALSTLTGESVTPRGSGRTDSGVHAEGQVASFALETDWDPGKLERALNGVLPADVGARQVARVAEGFDALRDAIGKEYRYRIWNRRERSPLRRAVCPYPIPVGGGGHAGGGGPADRRAGFSVLPGGGLGCENHRARAP